MSGFLESQLFSAFEMVKFHARWTTKLSSSLIVRSMWLESGTSPTQGEHLGPRDMCSGSTRMGKMGETWGWINVGPGLCLLQLPGVRFLKE